MFCIEYLEYLLELILSWPIIFALNFTCNIELKSTSDILCAEMFEYLWEPVNFLISVNVKSHWSVVAFTAPFVVAVRLEYLKSPSPVTDWKLKVVCIDCVFRSWMVAPLIVEYFVLISTLFPLPKLNVLCINSSFAFVKLPTFMVLYLASKFKSPWMLPAFNVLWNKLPDNFPTLLFKSISAFLAFNSNAKRSGIWMV